MVVPKELYDKWSLLRSKGDARKIAESMPEDIRVSDETIRLALNTRRCSDAVFKAIADFYTARERMVNQYLEGTTADK